MATPGDVTLVIAGPAGDALDDVQEVLTAWAGAGLVRPFLWWCDGGDADHRVRWNGSTDAVPLLEAIGTQPHRTVRLVSLLVVAEAADVRATEVRERAAAVEQAVAPRLGLGQRIARVNLVVPASRVAGLPMVLLDSYWDVNLVAADEDRRTPAHPAPEIMPADRLGSHTAAVLVTVAGLWPGMTEAPFDGVREGGRQAIKVRVVRSFARVLRSHGLVDGITELILDRRESRQWLADAVDAVPAHDPEPIVARGLREFLAGPGVRLDREPATPPPPPAPRTLTPWTAFRELGAFLWHLGRRTPFDVLEYGRDKARKRLEDFTQRTVFGEGSTAAVTMGTRTFAAQALDGRGLGEGGAAFAGRLLDWLGERPPVAALGEEWRCLAALTFGLVDGGPLPAGMSSPTERARRVVVPDLEWLAPNPFEEPFVLDAAPQPVPKGLASAAPAGGEAPSVSVAPCDPAGAAEAAALIPAGSPERERFDGWLAQRRTSLLWRLGERISAAATAAQFALAGALEVFERPAEDLEIDRRETSRMYRTLLLVALLALVGVGVVALLGVNGILSTRDAPLVGALAVLGWAAASLAIFYPYARRQFRLANARQERFEAERRARAVAEHEAKELIRLAAAYTEYRDWAVILGAVLHRPGGAPQAAAPDTVDLCALRLPNAVAVSAAETDQRQRRRLAAVVGRKHFHRGWASGLLIGLKRESMAELKFAKGRSVDDPDPEPEVDREAREYLIADATSGTAGEVFGRRVRDDVTRHVGELALAELFSGLTSSQDVSPTEFLLAPMAEPGPDGPLESFSWRMWRPGRSPHGDETIVWVPASVPIPGRSGLRTTGMDERSSVVLLVGVRLDASTSARWSDLAIFEEPRPESGGQDSDLGGIG